MVISLRVCPMNPFKLFWRTLQWVIKSQIHYVSMVRQQVYEMMPWLVLSSVISSHKDQLPQGIRSKLQGDLQRQNCFMDSNPTYFCSRSTQPENTLKIQVQEGASANSSSVLLHNPLLLKFSQAHSTNFTPFMHEVVTNSNL